MPLGKKGGDLSQSEVNPWNVNIYLIGFKSGILYINHEVKRKYIYIYINEEKMCQ